MKGFVHESGSPVGVYERFDASFDLRVVVAGQSPHDQAHGPDHVGADMRSADPFGRRAPEEIGVRFAPYETPGVPVDGIVLRDVSQIGHGEQAGDVGIVHQQAVAETVCFESVDLPELRMVADGMLFQGLFDLVGERFAGGCQGFVAVYRAQDLRSLAQRRDGEEVGRNQKRKGRGVVRRPERRGDESDGFGRMSVSVFELGVQCIFGHALESVRPRSFAALLVAQGFQHEAHGFGPPCVEHRGVARGFPVAVGQSDHVTRGVQLPFAFVQFGLHLRPVVLPAGSGGAVVEGVGIGVRQQAFQLAADDAPDQPAQGFVLARQREVGPHLSPRIAQPHGVDVTRIYKGVVFALLVLTVVDGGVERVGEAVFEHPCQLGNRDHLPDAFDLPFDGLRSEEPLRGFRTVGCPVIGAGCADGRRRGEHQGQKKQFFHAVELLVSAKIAGLPSARFPICASGSSFCAGSPCVRIWPV